VRFIAEQGIRQFIDIGTGLPTRDNVHEVVQSVTPDARVAYVDNDPIVLAHARALLADNPNTIVVAGDLRRPADILADERLRELIDIDQPVALLLFGILYFLTDDDEPQEIVRQLRNALAPGSYLALSHVVTEDSPEAFAQASRIYGSALHRPTAPSHPRESVLAFFDGLEMVDPGLVPVQDWHADESDTTSHTWMVGGVGYRP
jgi:O-methyltransferase involved in polyketide biosynthesis